MTSMPYHIRDRAALALTYAQDGAYRSAARILTALAIEVTAHAERVQPAPSPEGDRHD